MLDFAAKIEDSTTCTSLLVKTCEDGCCADKDDVLALVRSLLGKTLYLIRSGGGCAQLIRTYGTTR